MLYKGKPRLCAFGINRKIDDKINEPNLKDLSKLKERNIKKKISAQSSILPKIWSRNLFFVKF